MRKMLKMTVLIPAITALAVAGPPSGGHASSGGRAGGYAVHPGPPALSGPTPIGATGTAPVGAAGSLRPTYGSYGNKGSYGYYGGYGTHGGYNGVNGGKSGHGDHGSRYPYAYYPGAFVMPFYGYGYNDSYFDNGYGPGPDYGPDPQAVAQQALGDQVQHLTAEIEDLRDQQRQAAAPAPSPVPPAGQSPADTDTERNEAPITVVLHSGQQLQVRNYAVTDGVFWDFSKRPAQKIPVSAIDIAASQKATAASGGDFPAITQ
jgi:hypothetical protein